MLSVTQRIKSVSQPKGGYVPSNLFRAHKIDDGNTVSDVEPVFSPIQGLAVDYLTRFMLSGNKQQAFDISIRGAVLLDRLNNNNNEYIHIMSMLKNVNGLDDISIVNVCNIVEYDTVYRIGAKYYKSNVVAPSDDVIKNIRIMVNRTISFLKKVGPVIADGFNFDGGYTALVNKGDGDFLTNEYLIDLKVSKSNFSSEWSLQLLMYYLLGIHSKHQFFQSIKYLCIFNPNKNECMTARIDDISNEVKYKVSHDVLGYKMKYSDNNKCYSHWREIEGSDDYILFNFFYENKKRSNFDINNFSDGIFDISIIDYWTFLCSIDTDKQNILYIKPKFQNTEYIKMVKRAGFIMFFSVSPKGSICILNGGHLKKAEFPLQYYYDNIERYANVVNSRFSNYWSALQSISDQVRQIKPSKEYLHKHQYVEEVVSCLFEKKPIPKFDEWYQLKGKNICLSGKIHGCIVDLDYYNHIYLNPYDGTVVPYYALSMYDKDVYKNVISLISAHLPEMLESVKHMAIGNSEKSLPDTPNNSFGLLVRTNDVIETDYQKVYSYEMYNISNRLKTLQSICKNNLVQVWYDDILNDRITPIENQEQKLIAEKHSKYIGMSVEQKGGKGATIIKYRNCNDADALFEDGTLFEHIKIDQWRKGRLVHPEIEKQLQLKKEEQKNLQEHRKSKENTVSPKEKYIGMTKVMKCGLTATIIEYIDCKNVTVKFEDGLIKTGVRPDHFMEGKVSHKNGFNSF